MTDRKCTPSAQDVFAGMPSMTRLSFAHCDPGEPVEPEPGTAVQFAIDEPDAARVVVVFQHSAPGWGFGDFTIIQTPKGVFIDTERTNIERVKAAICAYLDTAITDHDEDPERHKAFMEALNGHCGPACRVCNPKVSP